MAQLVFLKVKAKFHFYKKQVINKIISVIFGHVRLIILSYHIAAMFGGGKFGEFGKSSMISQTKIINLELVVTINNNLLADPFIS